MGKRKPIPEHGTRLRIEVSSSIPHKQAYDAIESALSDVAYKIEYLVGEHPVVEKWAAAYRFPYYEVSCCDRLLAIWDGTADPVYELIGVVRRNWKPVDVVEMKGRKR